MAYKYCNDQEANFKKLGLQNHGGGSLHHLQMLKFSHSLDIQTPAEKVFEHQKHTLKTPNLRRCLDA